MAIQYDRTAPILDNTAVDNIVDSQGVIDSLASLSLDIDDKQIIQNLNMRIEDSERYWNDAKGFDLKNARNENERMHLGKIDEGGLYKHQKQYKENQIFVAEESIVAYVTSQIAGPQVIPAGPEDMHKLFASDLEKAINCHNEEIADLESLVELCARDILHKRISIIKFRYDKTRQEIIPEHKDPSNVILDKDCAKGGNPKFICDVLKSTPEELINEYPDKEKEILSRCGISRKTPLQMTKELAIREVWLTHYDNNNQPQEGLVIYFEDVILLKSKNPNYLYAKKNLNLVDYPKKPYIFGNLVNYGNHLIDRTTPLEQATDMQKYLMRRGRQIAENADKANGILVISTNSGLSKDDGQNLTGDPNQKLFIADENGLGVEKLVSQLQAQVLPPYVMNDKLDARMQIGNIMGAPTDFTGAHADDGDPTLGEVMVKKNQAAGRQDLMVRAITRMLRDYYQYLVQMMIVWYTEEHHFTYDSGDGEFDYITLKRELIHQGIRVKASQPANPDRSRIEAIVLNLMKQKAISLLDAFRLLQLDNPQQLYDNWAKQTSDPNSLARDALDIVDESEAYVAFNAIMAGKDIPVKDNPSKEYILSLRKLMINDLFLKAKKSDQNRFIKYVNKCLDSLEMRLSLEDASAIDPDGQGLKPGAPLPNPNQPPQQQPQPGQGMPPGQAPMGMPPNGGQPGQMPMPSQSMPPGMPPMGAQPPMTASSVFGGTPIPSPGQNITPQAGNPASLPQL